MIFGFDARLIGFKNGGIGRYSQELLAGLLNIDSKNSYKIFYNQTDSVLLLKITDKYKNAELIPANIKHYSLAEQIRYPRLLKKTPLDLMFFPNFNVPIKCPHPFVVTIHDLVHHKISGAKKSRLLHFWAYKKVIQNAARRSAAVISVSESAKKDIEQFLNVNPQKISVVYEGFTMLNKPEEKFVEEVKARYILRRPFFLFVGTLERKKNLINLCRGFDIFIEKYGYDFDLVIAGKTDKHYPDIRHHAMDIKHKNRLVFTGEVSDPELSALYASAYAYVSASMNEGFGLPGVEAMSFGLPLLAANTETFNEIYDDAAVYFDGLDTNDIAEKMNLLARDADFFQTVKEKSWKRSLIFDWKNCAEKTLRILETSAENNNLSKQL